MTDTKIRDENGTLAVSILQHVRDDAGMSEGENVSLDAQPGIFLAMSDEQLTVEQQRTIEDAVRDVLGDVDDLDWIRGRRVS